MIEVPPPTSEAELLARARALAGHPLGWVAQHLQIGVPADLRRDKGWIGNLLEAALGATAGSRAEPDFPGLGVEMKTLPVSPEGVPRESTFVATTPMDGSMAPTWAESWVRRKLSRVLWVPIITPKSSPPGERIVGEPLLWSPSPEEEAVLQADWEWMSELIALGEFWQIDARRGTALQLRPKAANADQLAWSQDEEGDWVRVRPRGFYLRASFTKAMLQQHFRLGAR